MYMRTASLNVHVCIKFRVLLFSESFLDRRCFSNISVNKLNKSDWCFIFLVWSFPYGKSDNSAIHSLFFVSRRIKWRSDGICHVCERSVPMQPSHIIKKNLSLILSFHFNGGGFIFHRSNRCWHRICSKPSQ